MLPSPGPYLAAFEILTRDFQHLGEYIDLSDPNLFTYSHRLYELFLRTCTEFESICKEALIVQRSPKAPKDMNINDYKTLDASLHLENTEVGIVIWQPTIKYTKPFQNWTRFSPPLKWYNAYNRVKHNRNTEFNCANLENVSIALAGLFAILDAVKVIQHGSKSGVCERVAKGGTARERVFPGEIFTIIC